MSPQPPLLRVSGLMVESEPRATVPSRRLLEDFSLDIAPGEFVAVVGESGSGKTMAARAILDLLPPGVRRRSGTINLGEQDLGCLSPAAMRAVRGRDVGMVFQEPMVSLNPALTIGRQLAEGLRLHHRLSAAEIRQRCLQMLARIRIKDAERCLKAYPHEFSGGMRQRIMLASVMLLKPKLLIADEPTTALDTLSQRDVMELMVQLGQEDGAAILLITHDLGVVSRYARRVVVLEKGRTVERGETRAVLASPSHPYTRKLLDSLPRRPARAPSPSPRGGAILRVDRACVEFSGRAGMFSRAPAKRILKDVSLAVHSGEIVALVGASGSGKTTLGRAIVGLAPLSGGSIHVADMDVNRLTRAQTGRFRQTVQLVFQDPFSSLDPRMRVADIVAAPLRNLQVSSPSTRRARAEAILEEVGLGGFGERYPHQMSGGQRQRVAIARAIIGGPHLVVADEPVSALDVTIQSQVLRLLRNLQAQYGFACVFITHDLSVVAEIADRVVVLSEGEVVESGETGSVLDNPQRPYTRALLDATPSLDLLRPAHRRP